jgi:hypothetical protein
VDEALGRHPDEGILRGNELFEKLMVVSGADQLFLSVHDMSGHPIAVTCSEPSNADWVVSVAEVVAS